MALWPFSRAYYESDLHVFMAISRRYYQGWGFVAQNVRAVCLELVILVPILALCRRASGTVEPGCDRCMSAASRSGRSDGRTHRHTPMLASLAVPIQAQAQPPAISEADAHAYDDLLTVYRGGADRARGRRPDQTARGQRRPAPGRALDRRDAGHEPAQRIGGGAAAVHGRDHARCGRTTTRYPTRLLAPYMAPFEQPSSHAQEDGSEIAVSAEPGICCGSRSGTSTSISRFPSSSTTSTRRWPRFPTTHRFCSPRDRDRS